MMTHADAELTTEQISTILRSGLRAAGRGRSRLQYIVGETEFYGLTLPGDVGGA